MTNLPIILLCDNKSRFPVHCTHDETSDEYALAIKGTLQQLASVGNAVLACA